MIQITELGIEVEYVSEFNDEASDILTDFCEKLKKNGGTRPITEDDIVGDYDGDWLWTDFAVAKIDKEIDRLSAIGCKYFDKMEVDIYSHMYKDL